MSLNIPNVISGVNGILTLVNKVGGKLSMTEKNEADKLRQQVNQCLLDIAAYKIEAEQNVERILAQARKKGVSIGVKKSLYVKWQIARQQADYMSTMYDNMLMIQARMQVSEMTVEFGQAIRNVTEILKQNNKRIPDFDALMKKFNKQIQPINEVMGDNFKGMTETLIDVESLGNPSYSLDAFEAEVSRSGPEVASASSSRPEFLEKQEERITQREEADLSKLTESDEMLKTMQQLAKELGGEK